MVLRGKFFIAFKILVVLASSTNYCAAATSAPIVLPRPSDPACIPTPKPSATPSGTPAPTPTPVVFPVPPKDLPPDGPDPKSTGSEIIDRALTEKSMRGFLPLWHDYPWKKNVRSKLWSAFTVETLRTEGKALLESVPADIQWYCPRYSELDKESRIAFWTRFISIVAEQESTFDPFEVTWAPNIDGGVFSTGLMMLSVSSVKMKYYDCTMIRNQDDLFDWRKNMTCAVRILSKLISKNGAVSWQINDPGSSGWQGMAKYWDTVRDPRMKTEIGRSCLDQTISARKFDWIKESKSSRHPSLRDGDYQRAGETRFERFLRQINHFPNCH